MTAPANLTCPTLIKLALDYDPDTGIFHWKKRPDWMFVDKGKGLASRASHANRWNGIFAGKETGHVSGKQSYKVVVLFGIARLAHRLAFVCMNGEWPKDQVDHINGDKSDNRWGNLREVNNRVNMRNQRIPKSNTSGHMGVRQTAAGTYHSYIWVKGKSLGLGTYPSIEEAIEARKGAEKKFGFHKNHGRA